MAWATALIAYCSIEASSKKSRTGQSPASHCLASVRCRKLSFVADVIRKACHVAASDRRALHQTTRRGKTCHDDPSIAHCGWRSSRRAFTAGWQLARLVAIGCDSNARSEPVKR